MPRLISNRFFKAVYLFSAFSLFFLKSSASSGQDKTELPFELLTIEDGLSQGMVNCILQDQYGFLWFGTKDGLNRYDGLRFVVYKRNSNDSTSLSDNYVQTIFEDSKKRLWIGTSQQGLERFDRETETFHHLNLVDDSTANPSGNSVIGIQEDHDGNLWIGTNNGLYKITINDQKHPDVKTSRNPEVMMKKYFGSSCNFAITQKGELWGGSRTMGAFLVHPQKDGNDRVDTLDKNKYFWAPDASADKRQYYLIPIEDKIHHKMYLIYPYCILQVDLNTRQQNIVYKRSTKNPAYASNAVFDLHGNLWIASSGSIEIFNPETGTLRKVSSANKNLENIVQFIKSSYVDRSGIIWLGSMGYGLLKFNPSLNKFHSVSCPSVGCMSTLSNGKILCALPNSFLGVFDPHTESFSTVISDSAFMKMTGIPVAGKTISAVQDSKNNIWLCKEYLIRHEIKTGKTEALGERGQYGVPIYLDENGGLWYGTEKAFTHYDPARKKFSYWYYPFSISNIPYFFLQTIYRTPDGDFWLGTTNGLLHVDFKKGKWENFTNRNGDTHSISNNVIFSLLPDPLQPKRFLWLGTNGGGLNRMDLQTRKFLQLSTNDGLPNNVVYGILADKSNHLWLSTNNGLSSFDPEKMSFKNFDSRDGLQSNEFNRNAFCKDSEGNLLFGGINGLNFFRPDEIKDNPTKPSVVITGIKLINQPLVFSHQSKILRLPPYLAKDIAIHYKDNMITFEFASLEFSAPKKNQYQYQLTGFDKGWINSGHSSSAIYTNLDPGEYVFKVRGSNNDGVWSDRDAFIRLNILPPWYMTWWLKFLVITATFAAVYLIYSYRLNQALKIQQLRNRIASDLHDDIGSALSSISLYGEATKMVVKDNPDAIRMLNRINENTHTMMEAMSDIVWTINTRNDRFDEAMNKMQAFAVHMMEAIDCEVHFNSSPDVSKVMLDMNQRKNIYLIFKEAVNNAAKYSHCKNLYLDFSDERSVLRMKISDDGKGFDVTKASKGNGLINMRQRARDMNSVLDIHSEAGQGTSVEFMLKR